MTFRVTPVDLQIADKAATFYADPLGFVMWAYPWDDDPSLQIVKLQSPWDLVYNRTHGPDVWACELLESIGAQVNRHNFNGRQAVEAIREAIASGHGIGKSAFVAWLVNWIMSTRPFSQGTVTANTGPQLETKTWAQIAKWTKLSITGHWFDITTGRGSMKMVSKTHPDSWFCTAQTCREENSEAFAGQHAANSTSFYIFDEASAVPDSIKEVAEGGLTDGEPMMFAFGNPTRNSGWFRDCFNSLKGQRWHTKQIDSRSVQITNKDFIQQLIDDYGIDSDFVKVRVRGMFPSMSAKQFIGVEDVDAAFGRHLRLEQYSWAPKVISVDPAWEGDDEMTIGLLQGLKFQMLRTIPKNDNDVEVAGIIAQLEDDHKADAVFIDAGYGTGIASVGRTMNRDWQLVWFGAASPDPAYLNMRSYMWGRVKAWLKNGGSIPKDQRLYDELIGPETVPRLDGKIQLEAKKDMKARDLPSPNRADCLGIALAYPVKPKNMPAPLEEQAARTQSMPHDPYADPGVRPSKDRAYDPYAQNLQG